MTYQAPLADMGFALSYGAGLPKALESGLFGDLGMDDIEAIIGEAGRIAAEVIAPLNRDGDRVGATFDNGAVVTAPGFKDAYRTWREGGWNGLASPEAFGGQGLPQAVNAACTEMWNGAAMAFALCPLLTMGAIDALYAHGSDELKRIYLQKLVTGEWTGTMHLTEPQAGSDVGALRTKAERAADGSYRITGQKIFITYGEHDFTDNIIHLVLARLPDAPPGTRGISLFLVPKFLVDADGTLGRPQRRARPRHRAQARHPRLADLHHDPRRSGRRRRLSDRPGKCRHGLHVHDDESRPPRRRPARRRHRRARDAAGARLCPRAQAGPRSRHAGEPIGADHRASRRQAHASDHARDDPSRALHLLRHRARARPGRARRRQGGAAGGARARFAAHARRQGVLVRHRRRSRLARRAGAWRHGLHRGDRRGAALSRRPHFPDLRRHQRHPGDRPRHPQAAARERRRRRRLSRRTAFDRRGA